MSALSAVPPTTALALASVSDIPSHVIYSQSQELASFLDSINLNDVPIPLDRKIYDDKPIIETHPYDDDFDFSRIHTPYNPAAFHVYLSKAKILDRYPDLPFKLKHGFSLGPIPNLMSTYAPDNPPYVYEHEKTIREYIDGELALGRFSGPFTKSELESKIGPFRSSPIQVVVKDDGPLTPKKYRCCRNLSFRGNQDNSINDLIGSENFHTRWYNADQCADIVRTIYFAILSQKIRAVLIERAIFLIYMMEFLSVTC